MAVALRQLSPIHKKRGNKVCFFFFYEGCFYHFLFWRYLNSRMARFSSDILLPFPNLNNLNSGAKVCMANTLIICMLKEYIQMWNWFYLANPPIMMFVGSALEPGIILYTSHFLFGVLCVRKLYLGDPQWSLMEERVACAWMLDWQAVWALPFVICRAYREFGKKVSE